MLDLERKSTVDGFISGKGVSRVREGDSGEIHLTKLMFNRFSFQSLITIKTLTHYLVLSPRNGFECDFTIELK